MYMKNLLSKFFWWNIEHYIRNMIVAFFLVCAYIQINSLWNFYDGNLWNMFWHSSTYTDSSGSEHSNYIPWIQLFVIAIGWYLKNKIQDLLYYFKLRKIMSHKQIISEFDSFQQVGSKHL